RAVPRHRRRPGLRRGPGGRRGHRDLRRRPLAQTAPARQRDHGLGRPLRRGRRAPAQPGDRAEPVPGRRRPGHPLLHPGARPDAPRHPGHLHRPDRPRHRRRRRPRRLPATIRGRALRAPAARGGLAHHRHDPGRQHGPGPGHRRRGRRADGRLRRTRQPGQGDGGRSGAERQHRARPPRDRRPARRRRRPLTGAPTDLFPRLSPRLKGPTVSVTAPRGFRAAGVAAGIKADGARDVAVVINDGPSRAAAAVFTRNRVKAAPVLWSEQVAKGGRVRAVLLNSGGANACTGAPGFADAHTTAERTADALGDSAAEILVCSTGLIGERLPMPELLAGVDTSVAAAARDGGLDAADAIRTTDSVAKISFRRGDGYTVGGMAKGAGMLAPALATMLAVVTTDADLTAEQCDRLLRAATAASFDRIDADGCLSTNDTVVLMASGASGTTPDEEAFAA